MVGCSIQSLAIITEVENLWAEAGLTGEYLAALRSVLLPESANRVAHAALVALPAVCCEASGGDRRRADAITAAWGLLYAAAHLLDSIEDGDAAEESWVHWGIGPAVNVSTGLIASAFLVLSRLVHRTAVEDRVRADELADFSRALLRMCSGQHADLTRSQLSLAECWQVAADKSGAFFALACRAGARLATADTTQIDYLSQFGLDLGLLIQIGDDIRGLYPQGREQGDLAAGRTSVLPIAYAMSVLPDSERARLCESLQAAPQNGLAQIQARQQIVASGALLYLSIEAERHAQQAETALQAAAAPSPARDELGLLLSRVAAQCRL